jgi:hypothetical protein
MTRFAAVLMGFALAGCAAAPAQDTQKVEVGSDFTMAPGSVTSIGGTGLSIRFMAVTEDTRCPRDTTCVWAGEVKVQLEIRQPAQAAALVEIAEGGSTAAGEYRLTVLKVEPLPTSTAKIAPRDYRATLRTDAGA